MHLTRCAGRQAWRGWQTVSKGGEGASDPFKNQTLPLIRLPLPCMFRSGAGKARYGPTSLETDIERTVNCELPVIRIVARPTSFWHGLALSPGMR